jgi:N-acetylglucosaminyl-diphospho-decaprenol L-rhamnosyltransferase
VNLPTLDIIIVNWNAGRQLETTLRSIATARSDGFTLGAVVVVDNGSTDDSLQLPALDLPLRIVRNRENRGFAAACNQGAREGSGDVILLLNPDTELEADSLRVPLDYLAAPGHERVGIIGIQLVDDQRHVARSCARCARPAHFWIKLLGLDRLFPGRFVAHVMEEWPHDATRPVDHVIGAFYMVRRPLWDTLGGFDERFFVYLEDLDFSCRAKAAGWTVMFLTEARARHAGGGTSDRVKALRLALSLESRIRYGFKHFSLPQGIALAAATLVAEPVIRLADALGRGRLQTAPDIIGGFWLLYSRLMRR